MDYTTHTEGIIRSLKEAIKYDIAAGIDRPMNEYLDRALEDLKRRFQMVNKWSRYKPWTAEDRKEVIDIWHDIKPEILSAIEKNLYEFKQKKLTMEIKVATARAAIKAAMHEAGLKHHFIGQTHRAKVSVILTPNRALTFYVSYKKLYDQLPRIIESLKLIRQELEHLGNNVSINKVYCADQFI